MPLSGFPPTYTQVSGAITAFAGQTVASATWNNVHADLGTSIQQLGQGLFGISSNLFIKGSVNFNAGNTDTAFTVPIPTGFIRYQVIAIIISGASGTLTTATCGVFTATGGGGVAIVTAASGITVSTAAENTLNNSQGLVVNNAAAQSYTANPLYFRVATAQGVAATGIVTIVVRPCS
jgi:hypothetical protein